MVPPAQHPLLLHICYLKTKACSISFTSSQFSSTTTGMGGHSLLWEIFPTQGLNRGLLCCRWILHHLSHLRSPLPLLRFANMKSWDRQTAIHGQAVASPDQYCVVLTVIFLFVAAPTPKRQKCDHWSPCPADTYAYRLLSGGGRDKYAKICFEAEM